MAGPTLLFQSGVHGSRPAASDGCVLYSCTTHSLVYRSDGTAWSTWMTIPTGASVATDPIFDAAGDLAVGSGADTAAKLAKGSTAQVLVSTAAGLAWADVLPWHIWVIPMMTTPDATTGTWDPTGGDSDSGLTFLFYTPGSTANSGKTNRMFNSSAAQNDAWAVDVILAAGTWDAHFWVRKSSGGAIITLNQDGSSMGTVDTYAASPAAAKVSITGWSVSTTGKKRMQLLLATKNASSSGYLLGIQGIEFRRTA